MVLNDALVISALQNSAFATPVTSSSAEYVSE